MTVSHIWVPSIALLALAGACTNAQFARIDDGQSTTTTTTSTTTGTGSRTCAAPNLACAGPSGPGLCDPVCQTGGCDWCGKKCSYAFASTGSAQLTCAVFGQKKFPESCTPGADGSDDCAPGSICLAPTIGDTAYFCFTLCNVPGDCPGAVNCGARKLTAGGGEVTVCDPPYDQVGSGGCNPLEGTGCDKGRACLLVSADKATNHSRTMCEFSYGDGRNGKACTSTRDCMTKNTCVDGACRQICDKAQSCPSGATCTMLGSDYGYCI